MSNNVIHSHPVQVMGGLSMTEKTVWVRVWGVVAVGGERRLSGKRAGCSIMRTEFRSQYPSGASPKKAFLNRSLRQRKN